jgi:hypothetical protein
MKHSYRLMGGLAALFLGLTLLVTLSPTAAQEKGLGDNIFDGELYPHGYTPMEIKNGIYPRMYTPNTEKLGPKEMRVTALGTGMPSVITGKQKASGWYVELGNGEKFLFDLGSGTLFDSW